MAFPDVTPADASAALSLLANNATNAGLTPSAGMGPEGLRDAVLGNLLTSLPSTTDLPSSIAIGAQLTPGAGTAGVGGSLKTSVVREGGLIITTILIDLTGLASAAAGDVIGLAAGGAAYLGQITAAVNGTIMGGTLRCFEAPAGGDADIDVYSATAATAVYNDAISGIAGQVQVVNSGTLALTTDGSVIADTITANDYLYLVSVGATADTYTAGRICLTLYGV
jgi:hypothetical protein